jgi:cytochrome c oxidase assembly protein subunit 15
MPGSDRRFVTYAWVVLAYTFAVIVFGAWVRISGSGAGCGQHWPTCHGEVVHLPESIETMIELTHRVTSGLSLVMAIGLLFWGMARFPRPSLVRRGVGLAMVFMIFEALIGAGLVLLELVGRNDSISRAVVMAIHLSNTCFLTGAMTMAAWAAPGHPPLRWKGHASTLLIGGLIGIVLVSMSGAVTALGDTLYPVEGEWVATSTGAHFLQRMRVVHPLLAIGVALYLLWIAIALPLQPSGDRLRKIANACAGLVVAQLCAGVVNIMLSAPGWMQLVHLALATLVWIGFVLLTLEAGAASAGQSAGQVVPQGQAQDDRGH